MNEWSLRDGCDMSDETAPGQSNLSSTLRPRTVWTVTHPEQFVRFEAAARSDEEARSIALSRWYRRPVRSELEELTRAVFRVEDTGKPAEQELSQVPSGDGD